MSIKQEVDAKKAPLGRAKALELARTVSKIVAAKGKNVVELDLANVEATDEEIAKLIVGPSGNLRAPTLKLDKTLVVGFNEQMYQTVFG